MSHYDGLILVENLSPPNKKGKDTALILSESLLQLFPYQDENMSVDYLSTK
jgi:hypothetical protein